MIFAIIFIACIIFFPSFIVYLHISKKGKPLIDWTSKNWAVTIIFIVLLLTLIVMIIIYWRTEISFLLF